MRHQMQYGKKVNRIKLDDEINSKSRWGTPSVLLLISTKCRLPATQSTARLQCSLYLYISSKLASL